MTPNITEWSDRRLNKGITKLVRKPSQMIIDFCNNWNDLMPLVVEHHKDLILLGYKVDRCLTLKNSQRALAECVYLVLLAKSKEQGNA